MFGGQIVLSFGQVFCGQGQIVLSFGGQVVLWAGAGSSEFWPSVWWADSSGFWWADRSFEQVLHTVTRKCSRKSDSHKKCSRKSVSHQEMIY